MNYQLNEAQMFADITEGMAIVINSLTGVYYGMNGFGTSLFENLLAGSSDEEILAAVRALPGAADSFEASFRAFLETLTGYGILLPADVSAPRAAVVDASAAAADGFVPECKEFSDVQELLFADPIHEVPEEEGWKPEK